MIFSNVCLWEICLERGLIFRSNLKKNPMLETCSTSSIYPESIPLAKCRVVDVFLSALNLFPLLPP